MKTTAFTIITSLLLLLAISAYDRSSPRGSTRAGEVVIVPVAEARAHLPGRTTATVAPLPLSRIAIAAEADDVCAVINEYRRIGTLNPLEHGPLVRALGAPPAVQELFAAGGPLEAPATTSLDQFHHAVGRLAFALRMAGAYNGAGGTENLPRARELLLALEREDPANGAYPYFLLDVEKRLGTSDQRLGAIARRVARARRFETYFGEAQVALRDRRFQNAAYFYALGPVLDSLDGANLRSPANVLRALDEKLGTALAPQVGTLLQAKGFAARRGVNAYEFSAAEFDLGRELNGGRGPTAEALSEAKEGAAFPSATWLEEDGSCDEAGLRDSFLEIRNSI